MFSSVFATASVALEERGEIVRRKAGVSEPPIVFRYLVANPIPNIGLSIAWWLE